MARNFDHITHILRDLHWLPVNFIVQFKLLLQVYKTLHGLAPSDLSGKLTLKPKKGLRSDNHLLLYVPKSTLQLKYYGDKAFSVAGPTLWNTRTKENRLCKSVDSFKINLKTHFFKKNCGLIVELIILREMQPIHWLFFMNITWVFRRLIAITLWYCFFTIVTLILCLYFMIYCQET